MKPIAQLLREQRRKQQLQSKTGDESNSEEEVVSKRKESSKDHKKEKPNKSLMSLEEQIAMLEKEVDSDDSEDDSEEEEGPEVKKARKVVIEEEDDTLLVEKDSNGNVIRFVSSLQVEDRIAPLPKSLLPSKQCKFASHGASSSTSTALKTGKSVSFEPKKKVSYEEVQRSQESGLVKTVRELLQNYQPASSTERKPFYCRVCQFQGNDAEEWTTHRDTEFHKTAVELERRMCFCKLCRKQFTSPDQIKEHLTGKAHLERLERVRQAQQERKKFC